MIKGCGIKVGSWIWSVNREKEVEIGIGIEVMLVAVMVVVVGAVGAAVVEDIMTMMRDTVRIVVMGMDGRLMIGEDEVVLTFAPYFSFFNNGRSTDDWAEMMKLTLFLHLQPYFSFFLQ